MTAQLNLYLNKPKRVDSIDELAKIWKALIPPEEQEFFEITETTSETAHTEIHLHCPLRGTGNVEACYEL